MLIVHTTDLLQEDAAAFAHAVALARTSGAKLVSLHACAGAAPEGEFPDVESLLLRWSGAPDEVTHERMMHQCCDDVTDTLLDALRTVRPNLVVAATHARGGFMRLFVDSVAEGVARNVRVPTLLLPISGRGFVDVATGAFRLDSLLVPAGTVWEAASGVDAATWFARLVGWEHPRIVLLHVEDGQRVPRPTVPFGVELETRVVEGALDDAIVATANKLDPSVLVMATHGHDDLTDVVLGSHTERVLHRCERPMLWLPLGPPSDEGRPSVRAEMVR